MVVVLNEGQEPARRSILAQDKPMLVSTDWSMHLHDQS